MLIYHIGIGGNLTVTGSATIFNGGTLTLW